MWNKCCWWLIPVSSCSTLIGNGWEHQALELQTNLREKFYHYWLWRRPVDVKIRHRSKSHKGQAVLRIYDNQPARLLKPLCRRPDFKSILSILLLFSQSSRRFVWSPEPGGEWWIFYPIFSTKHQTDHPLHPLSSAFRSPAQPLTRAAPSLETSLHTGTRGTVLELSTWNFTVPPEGPH